MNVIHCTKCQNKIILIILYLKDITNDITLYTIHYTPLKSRVKIVKGWQGKNDTDS